MKKISKTSVILTLVSGLSASNASYGLGLDMDAISGGVVASSNMLTKNIADKVLQLNKQIPEGSMYYSVCDEKQTWVGGEKTGADFIAKKMCGLGNPTQNMFHATYQRICNPNSKLQNDSYAICIQSMRTIMPSACKRSKNPPKPSKPSHGFSLDFSAMAGGIVGSSKMLIPQIRSKIVELNNQISNAATYDSVCEEGNIWGGGEKTGADLIAKRMCGYGNSTNNALSLTYRRICDPDPASGNYGSVNSYEICLAAIRTRVEEACEK